MRKICLAILAAMFTVSMALSPALAGSCVSNMQQSTVMTMADDATSCHKPDIQQNSQYCGGLCLCDHFPANSSVYLKSNAGIVLPMALKEQFLIHDESLASLTLNPQEHPPKILS